MKPVPVRVTAVPPLAAPLAGLNAVTVGRTEPAVGGGHVVWIDIARYPIPPSEAAEIGVE